MAIKKLKAIEDKMEELKEFSLKALNTEEEAIELKFCGELYKFSGKEKRIFLSGVLTAIAIIGESY